ncbi:hypothetical protein GCM10027612_87850 [Microbispora bryophytorum subsp. camponoti]|uniref:Restriction endonuclease n=2 Tax=Microbispora bryophytorum TaxID=1460882 RepID=A0ABR8LI36_9ACTN|nr:hypothetical protein [Microbispora camponoti]
MGGVTEVLFRQYDLHQILRATSAKVEGLVAQWGADAFLKASEHDLIDKLVEEGSVRCPQLLRDQAWMPEMAEVDIEVHDRFFGETATRRGLLFTLVVPFTGEKDVFYCRPSTWTSVVPQVQSLNTRELRLEVTGQFTDPTQLNKRFTEELDRIDQYLAWCREEIDRHNAALPTFVTGLVSARKQKLLDGRNLQSQIGFPIRRRPDASAYSIPVTRKTVSPHRLPRPGHGDGEPFAPEPALSDADYEAALQVLDAQRNALERTPSVAAGMDEETIRNLLLVSLNAQFKGTAAGELFNGDGKTDILIRERDRNVFIGECKVWDGPQTVTDALDQLLGYLVWRDTKAALLMFIRTKAVTATVQAATAAIEAHPNYKRRGTHDTDGRIDVVMHANGDLDREIKLAFLPFSLPHHATSRFAKAKR